MMSKRMRPSNERQSAFLAPVYGSGFSTSLSGNQSLRWVDSVSFRPAVPGSRSLVGGFRRFHRFSACVPSPEETSPGQGAAPSSDYSLKTRLREETSAPFRKFRQFLWVGAAMSAAVGAFVSSLRVAAALSGVRGTQPISESATNVAVDIAAIAFFGWAWKREQDAANARLDRMRRGAAIAALKVEDPVSGKVLRLGEFRGRFRVVIVAAPKEQLEESMEEAQAQRDRLANCRIVVAPLELGSADASSATLDDSKSGVLNVRGSWVARPVDSKAWLEWFTTETSLGSNVEQTNDKTWVIVVKYNGRVGSRSIGRPQWEELALQSDRTAKEEVVRN